MTTCAGEDLSNPKTLSHAGNKYNKILSDLKKSRPIVYSTREKLVSTCACYMVAWHMRHGC